MHDAGTKPAGHGTGIFAGATGTGTVHTQVTSAGPPIMSTSTYGGTLTLH